MPAAHRSAPSPRARRPLGRNQPAATQPGGVVKRTSLLERFLPTLYEDDLLLAVLKPAGIDMGGAANQAQGLTELLTHLRGGAETLHPINRLSRYESGILLLGKSSTVAEGVRADIRAQRVHQEYDAVVIGLMRERVIRVGDQAGASRGRESRRGSSRARSGRGAADSQPTIITRKHQGDARSLVRVQCRVRTTHALRAQLRSADLRLLGDQLKERSRRPAPANLTCLHLSRLTLPRAPSGKQVNISTRTPGEFQQIADGNRECARALLAAMVRRLPLLLQRDSHAYRLLTGPVEDVAGVCAERYGAVIVLQVYSQSPVVEASLKPIARWYRDTLEVDAVYVKRYVRDRPGADEAVLDELHAEKPVLGKPAPETMTIRERGLKFLIKPYHGFSTGLFLDHRDNRAKVRSLSAGKDVLNLFAYTCGFSVVAAAGSARNTVSVDLAPKNLEWGRDNFALNGLEAANHEFIAADASDYLKRAARQGRSFDLILIDPPTFARARKGKKTFSISRDLASLISAASDVLRPDGAMMVSTNSRKMTRRDLRDRIKSGASGRKFSVLDSPPLPIDFAVDPDHAKTVFVRFR